MKIKRFLSVFTAMILIFSLSGCSKGRMITPKTPTDKKLTGNIIVYGEDNDKDAVQSFIYNFNKLYPDVKINFKALNSQELENEAASNTAAEVSDSGEPVKLIILKDCYIPEVLDVNPSSYYDLTKEVSGFKDDFNNELFRNLTYDNKVYAVPFSSSPEALIIRKDILESYGIDPKDIITWDDLAMEGSIVYDKSNKSINIFGIYSDEESSFFNLMFNQLNAGYIVNTDNEKANTDKEKRILNEVNYLNLQKVIFNKDINTCINNLKDGKLLSLYAGPAVAKKIMESCPELNGRLQVMKVPSFEPGGNEDVRFSGKSVMIKNTKTDLSAAVEFVKYMTTNTAAEVNSMKSSYYFPANNNTFEDTYFESSTSFYGGDHIWRLYADIFDNSPVIQYPKDYDSRKIKNNSAINDLLSGKGNVDTALAVLNEK